MAARVGIALGRCLELVPADERGDADGVLSVAFPDRDGSWEFDLDFRALGVTPRVGDRSVAVIVRVGSSLHVAGLRPYQTDDELGVAAAAAKAESRTVAAAISGVAVEAIADLFREEL